MTVTSKGKVDFSLDDVVTQIRELAAERPDFVYTSLQTNRDGSNAKCLYRHGEKPGCIVGQALDRLGYVVPQEHEGMNSSALLGQLYELSDQEALYDNRVRWIRNVQGAQDERKSWGAAVEQADRFAAQWESWRL